MAKNTTARRPGPLGTSLCEVGPDGWVKLPPAHREYLKQEGARMFVTTLEDGIVLIYPASVWRTNQDLLEASTEDPEIAEDIAFLANVNGFETSMDRQGRIPLPDSISKAVKPKSSVYLQLFNGRLSLFTERAYRERYERARTELERKLQLLRRHGLH
jgi:DNA-binding transcriptional regulator/RsmH inhibitor MraZ